MNTTPPNPSATPTEATPAPGFAINAHLVVGGSQTAGLPMTSPLTPILPSRHSQPWLTPSLLA